MRSFSKRFLLYLTLIFPLLAISAPGCFIISNDSGTLLHEEGDCKTRETPASTFKIPLALMGFDSGILKSPTEPVWDYKPEYSDYLESWKHSQTPRSWIKNSVVWYSQILTTKLGAAEFQEYVNLFDYGNKDLLGAPGKNNGLTEAWLGTSLKISPQEQIVFLKNLIHHQWALSPSAYEYTKDVLQRGTLTNGWKLYGKTGSDTPLGWFVGWIEKDDKRYIFAYLRKDEPVVQDPVQRAENRVSDVKAKLVEFLKTAPLQGT